MGKVTKRGKMDVLILFDIDGTLLRRARAHRDAFTHGFRKAYGINTTTAVAAGSGRTDPQVILAVMKKHGLTKEQISQGLPRCTSAMAEYYDQIKDEHPSIPLPGVRRLLRQLAKHGYMLGIVTGNLEPIARAKLQTAHLEQYFDVGAFGSDDASRTKLVRLAIKRATNAGSRPQHIKLIGDTPNDMTSAKKARAQPIGVTTGLYNKEALEKAGAYLIFESLADTETVLDGILRNPHDRIEDNST